MVKAVAGIATPNCLRLNRLSRLGGTCAGWKNILSPASFWYVRDARQKEGGAQPYREALPLARNRQPDLF